MRPLTQKKLLPWLIGVVIATLLFAALFLYTDFHYAGSDDTPILRSFMGYEGGVPAHYHLYLHTALAWLLHGLALAFPGVAWFSIVQLFLLWFSCVVIVKAMAQLALRRCLPLWVGTLMSACFLVVFPAFILCRISYTTTGALVGAAAVAQLFSVDYQKGTGSQVLRGMGLSIFLLLCCYCLRQVGVLPPLVFWALGLFLMFCLYYAPWGKALPATEPAEPSAAARTGRFRRPLRPFLSGVLLCLLSFGLLAGVRAVEINTLQLHDYLAWQNARINLLDYTSFSEDTDPALLEEIGWSPAECKLVTGWYFLDRNITAEAFEKLYAAQPEAAPAPFSLRMTQALSTLRGFFTSNPLQQYACLLLLALCMFCLLGALRRKGAGKFLALAAFFALLAGLCLLFYLAFRGRLPMRAAASVLFPGAVFLFQLCFLCLGAPLESPEPEKPARPSFLALVALAACLLLSVGAGVQTAGMLNPPADPDAEAKADVPADLDAYALENPDLLIIYDLSLVSDQRLFPDTSAGIPGNVLFWGGYPARSPSWLYQLAQYGIDGNAFTPEDFFRENVVVASTDGQPWESLTAYLRENAESPVDWDFYDESGYIGFYQYYQE